MGQSFWQKLQRVKAKDIGNIFVFALALPVSAVYKRKRKDLWLICDNENEARDNGYWLYKYIREHHKEQDVMYAINKKSPDYARVKDLGPVVQYGSFMHWLYYLTASKNISSQKEGKPNAAVCYLLEVYGILKNTSVFLQHGIIMNDLEFLHYKNTKMRMFMCTAEREFQYIKEKFGYPDGWIQKTGLCRFDNLFDTSQGKRQILVMPTWRNWISIPTTESYVQENITEFTGTKYFQCWNEILCDKKLVDFLEKEDIRLVFYPHRGMQKFIKNFQACSTHIVIAKWPEYDVQELLKESNFLITDYSSIAMDFAYLKKPLLYYQFDYEMFRRGQYSEGYFSYKEDGFGKVCEEEQDVVAEIKKIAESGMIMPDLYKQRVDEFFSYRDKENCERNYKAICKL